MSTFAVFGNPIKHSRSAEIYFLFAREIGISSNYDLKLVSKKEQFQDKLYNFFNTGGLGANITVPFKKDAFHLCDHVTHRALVANTVNTIKKEHDGTLLGDNTDGIGFISDLKRLNWINSDNTFSNIDCELNKNYLTSRVLLIGSGGAARGIIPFLLDIPGCYVHLVNRTFLNAQRLVQFYYSIGHQNISCIHLNKLFEEGDNRKYTLIINATSSSMKNDIFPIPSRLITCYTRCYDLFYKYEDTLFVKWCKKYGSHCCSDGLGMLVEQAAYSFYLWHGVFPAVDPVIFYLKSVS